MPGLVAFRRRWSVGSDDLVVPGIFLCVLHTIWLVAVSVVLGVVPFEKSQHCAWQLWEHLLGYVVILAGATLVEGALAVVALRGTILDASLRAPAQYLLYVRLAILCVELVWLSLGITWLCYYYHSCPVEVAQEVLLGMVICNGLVILSVLMTVWCTFDAAGRSWVKMKRFQRSMRASEITRKYRRSGSRHRNWRQRKVIRAYQESWNHRCRLLFCCMGKSDRSRNSFADIARLLSEFFRDLDVVPSDVVAGLVLLRKAQKDSREAIVKEHKNDTYQFLSGVAVTPAAKFVALNSPEGLEEFKAVVHYMHYALAAYGWPMYMMTNSVTGMCKLCPHLKCCCIPLCSHRGSNEAEIVDDNCCLCNFAALHKMCAVGDVDIVYVTYHVDVGETPFFVGIDYGRRKIVVSIRGTLSMKDIVTDLNAEGEPLPLTPVQDEWLGHKGMVQAAEYIRKKIQDEGILSQAFNHNQARCTQEFDLVLVGHSLGAGTAAILAILLRQEYPNLICYAYSPPGGLLSTPAVEYTKSFITSVVVGKDVVPRIGLHQLETLRADLIEAIRRSRESKWKTIAQSLLCCGSCKGGGSGHFTEKNGLKRRSSSLVDDEEREKSLQDLRDLTIHPSDSNLTLTVHQPLYPPGRIIHVVRHHPRKGEQRYESRWRQVVKKGEPVFQALWVDNADFDQVLISPVMVQDHMPDKVLQALQRVLQHIGPAKPHRILPTCLPCTTTTPATPAQTTATTIPIRPVNGETNPDSERCCLLPVTPGLINQNNSPGSPKVTTPPHRLLMETSFTSLTPETSVTINNHTHTHHHHHHPKLNGLLTALTWEYASALEDQLLQSCRANGSLSSSVFAWRPGPGNKDVANISDDWGAGRAPLASPETLSEVSSISSKASYMCSGSNAAVGEGSNGCGARGAASNGDARCSSGTLGDARCSSGALGHARCSSGTLGATCSRGTFGGARCSGGAECPGGTPGATCSSGTFGATCSSGTFGATCSSGNFGATCSSGTFGATCSSGNFGATCSSEFSGATCSGGAAGAVCSGGIHGAADFGTHGGATNEGYGASGATCSGDATGATSEGTYGAMDSGAAAESGSYVICVKDGAGAESTSSGATSDSGYIICVKDSAASHAGGTTGGTITGGANQGYCYYVDTNFLETPPPSGQEASPVAAPRCHQQDVAPRYHEETLAPDGSPPSLSDSTGLHGLEDYDMDDSPPMSQHNGKRVTFNLRRAFSSKDSGYGGVEGGSYPGTPGIFPGTPGTFPGAPGTFPCNGGVDFVPRRTSSPIAVHRSPLVSPVVGKSSIVKSPVGGKSVASSQLPLLSTLVAESTSGNPGFAQRKGKNCESSV